MTTQDKTEVSGAEPSEPGLHDGSNHDDLGKISRKRRKPLLHHDYVFSTFSPGMPNTKITPRSRAICPLCKEEVTACERFQLHVTQCAINPKRHKCHECGKDYKELVYLKRHIANTGHTQTHNVESVKAPAADSSSVSSWDSDSEVEIAGEP
ncbi:hypothetical protein DPMN_174535 [Dreissena polymorpha]|uniref:C2H2-type domain-containing protein n=1 Tax=Dreissena polymorpha TaxID=45954 RepID=A0A9D4IH78_DREPO|nr:hypothetical protein DPMN_174535 [Dreissena polymorpha]